MAGGRVSPTATLLRNSKLFSLPPPLPRPSQAHKYNGLYESMTATSIYPTHAAIQTTQSSLPRGDWGLKHSLPSKTIGKTSNATIRIRDIESTDHITEFESATDLTMTLLKFQELQLPITMSRRRARKASSPRGLSPRISVFESEVDNIQTKAGDMDSERWRFRGPSLAHETEGAFQKYVKKTVSVQKTAFRNLLREQLAQKKSTDRHERARNEGNDVSQDPIEVSDQQLDDHIKYLRNKPNELRGIIEGFLDLPRATRDSGSLSTESAPDMERNYAIVGPPKTHPSGGLSYQRTASRIYNHPILGPQDIKPPVEARYLVPQTNFATAQRSRALVGIGGVVAIDSQVRPSRYGVFDDTTVGNKHWFTLEQASVLNSGRIRLLLQRPLKAHLILFNGVEDENPDPQNQPIVPGASSGFPTLSDNYPQSLSPAVQRHGLAHGTQPSRPSSNGRVQPLDFKEAHAILNIGRLNGD